VSLELDAKPQCHLGQRWGDESTPRFDATNLEIVSVDVGNSAFNVIPAEARPRVNVRFNDH
jgi:acetylornithine deacetylase/succinyl-diaminopimelate desuccinylase-like protein